MKIYLGADHRGFELKEFLKKELKRMGFEVKDLGNLKYDPLDDFPDFAFPVARKIAKERRALGILLCGSGIGVSIAANRVKSVRACLGFDKDQVEKGRQHDHCNILCLPADYIDKNKALELVKTFLSTEPMNKEKYLRRIKKLDLNIFSS